jgi:hypothetical protein
MQVLTLAVIGQDLDEATLGNPPARTFVDHALQFDLERRQARNPLLDLSEPGAGNHVGCCTGLIGVILKGEQGADRVYLKPELAGMADERQTAQVASVVEPAVALGARRCWEKPNLLVVPDRRHLHAAAPGGFPDGYVLSLHERLIL